MKIQINSDKNITLPEDQETIYHDLLANELRRFSDHVTRLEVHFSDEDGIKNGLNTKRCLLEARLERMEPIAVTASAETISEALAEAIEKLISRMETIRGRFSDH